MKMIDINDILVTIIMPVYNTEEYLERAIKSLISQTHKNLQILLIDDGSSDLSGNICDSYAVTDQRIQVIHKKNGGASSARNQGLDKAKGTYILFADSDDEIASDCVSRLLQESERLKLQKKQKNCIVVALLELKGYYKTSPRCEQKLYERDDFLKHAYIDLEMKYMLITSVGMLFERKIIQNNHILFREDMRSGEDGIFVLNYMEYVDYVYTLNYMCYSYYTYRPEERMNSCNSRYIDEYEFYLYYFNYVSVLIDRKNIELLDEFFYNFMPVLVRLVAIGGKVYTKKQLIFILKEIMDDQNVADAARIYRRRDKKHSLIIPFCIKLKLPQLAYIFLKIRGAKMQCPDALKITTIYF